MKGLKRITILTSVFLILTAAKVFAGFSCSVNMSSTTNMIKAGDTITINVTLNNINLSDNSEGVTIFDGYLNYDTNVFEDISKRDINPGDNRSVTYIAASKRIFVEFDNMDGIIKTNGTTIFTITMRVKQNAKFTSTTVSLNNIALTDNVAKVTTNSSITFNSIPEEISTPAVIYSSTSSVEDNDKQVTETTIEKVEANTIDTTEDIMKNITTEVVNEINSSDIESEEVKNKVIESIIKRIIETIINYIKA